MMHQISFYIGGKSKCVFLHDHQRATFSHIQQQVVITLEEDTLLGNRGCIRYCDLARDSH